MMQRNLNFSEPGEPASTIANDKKTKENSNV